jgi:hypothetical protein
VGYTTQAQLTQQQARLDRLTQPQAARRQFMIDGEMRPVPVQFADQTDASAVLYAASDRVAMAIGGLPWLQGDDVYQCWWKTAQEPVAGTAFRVDDKDASIWVWKWLEGKDFDKTLITRASRTGQAKAQLPRGRNDGILIIDPRDEADASECGAIRLQNKTPRTSSLSAVLKHLA